jgi:glycine/D-amino acid oxidase-like deaminating enzyme
MPLAPRYDVVVVGGGLSGVAAATWLAKRGRRVALVEPRPEWGGGFSDQRIGGVTVSPGPRMVVGHERLGWADAYFEAVGLSQALMVREGATFKREPIQLIWGSRRLTLWPQRADFLEELRREYQVRESDAAALLADLDAVYEVLSIRFDPVPTAETKPSLARLRALAASRTFAARFGALAPAHYVQARGLANTLAPYLESWRAALTVAGDPAGGWLFRTALIHRGLIALPGGRAAVCRLLATRFQALGGEVVRAPVTAVEAGREPFVEADGRRFHSHVLMINTRQRPGSVPSDEGSEPMATAAYLVPSSCLPEAMGTHVLALDEIGPWSLTRRRHQDAVGPSRDALIATYRGRPTGRDAGPTRQRLEQLLPFAAGQLEYVGAVRDDESPDPVDPKLWKSVSWRSGRGDWAQASRAPVWWLPDQCAPWVGDALDYQAALGVVRAAQPAS